MEEGSSNGRGSVQVFNYKNSTKKSKDKAKCVYDLLSPNDQTGNGEKWLAENQSGIENTYM